MNILYLEDNQDDFELLDRVLRKSNMQYSMDNIVSFQEFEQIDTSQYDLILSDYNLNGFTGFDALKMVRARDLDIPFIVISGTVGEEQAVSLLHEGANDFLLKKNVRKLPVIVEKAILNLKVVEERREFEKQLINKNLILDSLFHSFEDLVFLKNVEGNYVKVNEAFCRFFALPERSIVGVLDHEIIGLDQTDLVRDTDQQVIRSKESITYETTLSSADDKLRIMEVVKTPVIDGTVVTGVMGCARDVTRRKELEQKEVRKHYLLNQAERLTNSGSFEYNPELDTLRCSVNFLRMTGLGLRSNVISLQRLINLIYKEDQRLFREKIRSAFDNQVSCTMEHRYQPVGSDEIRYGRTTINVDLSVSDVIAYYGTTVDITAEKRTSIATNEIQEKERSNIARELHDNLGQKLSASCLFLDSLSSKYHEDNEIKKVKQMVEESLQEIRQLSGNLSLNIIKKFGLVESIAQLGNQIPADIDFCFDGHIHDKDISEFISIQCFRIVQECISNSLKHSGAKTITVNLNQETSLITLRVRDDGAGFDTSQNVQGNGLHNLRQRVRQCHGLIDISSKVGKGTLIDMKLPLK